MTSYRYQTVEGRTSTEVFTDPDEALQTYVHDTPDLIIHDPDDWNDIQADALRRGELVTTPARVDEPNVVRRVTAVDAEHRVIDAVPICRVVEQYRDRTVVERSTMVGRVTRLDGELLGLWREDRAGSSALLSLQVDGEPTTVVSGVEVGDLVEVETLVAWPDALVAMAVRRREVVS